METSNLRKPKVKVLLFRNIFVCRNDAIKDNGNLIIKYILLLKKQKFLGSLFYIYVFFHPTYILFGFC